MYSTPPSIPSREEKEGRLFLTLHSSFQTQLPFTWSSYDSSNTPAERARHCLWCSLHQLTSGGGRLREGLKGTLGSQHTTLHGCVAALDLGHIQEASTAADESSSREGKLGQALQPSLVQGSGSIGHSPSSLQQPGHVGVVLPELWGGQGGGGGGGGGGGAEGKAALHSSKRKTRQTWNSL